MRFISFNYDISSLCSFPLCVYKIINYSFLHATIKYVMCKPSQAEAIVSLHVNLKWAYQIIKLLICALFIKNLFNFFAMYIHLIELTCI